MTRITAAHNPSAAIVEISFMTMRLVVLGASPKGCEHFPSVNH